MARCCPNLGFDAGQQRELHGSGCRWNAVASQAPWVTITSPSNGEGLSSGSIGFTVAANPQTIPRTGFIVAGNGTSSATFTVQEGGACYYTLSDGPVIAIQPSGGTYAVSVTATSGCVWSAVSNTSWITISAGASGTGSGSFSFTATPNSSASDLTGTITVMNQTLTVIIGTPQGTPSTGWVSISGSEQQETINMCPGAPNPCWATIPNGGSITVTVGSESFGVGYSCCSDPASSLATRLANNINSTTLAPIEATVSGSKVTITSTISGAATNYPLSVSYTYNSTYYSSPAMTASTSGPTLTGGTD
ncbi:MAG: hypothetical protein DMG21_06550 [Acidobacteria bacterium]|nr:MAG: hypothetical protein DMG21_06550 [Acidobacteriota bacterium]